MFSIQKMKSKIGFNMFHLCKSKYKIVGIYGFIEMIKDFSFLLSSRAVGELFLVFLLD